MAIKTKDLIGPALDWAVATLLGYNNLRVNPHAWDNGLIMSPPRSEYGPVYLSDISFSTNWEVGGLIIERQNITIIRANDCYAVDAKGFTTSKRIPRWFAETSRWTGHSITTSYEGENIDSVFMIDETGGYYGETPLIAAMRCFVASELGDEVEIPDELLT